MILKNKTAIITGGTGGIGKAIAEHFLKEGARVLIVSRNKNKLRETQKYLSCFGKIYIFKADIALLKDIKKAVLYAKKIFKNIDILVNCAGIQAPLGPFVKNNLLDWWKNIKINLLGTVAFTKEILPLMLARKSGKIINFSGGGATSSRPNFSAYAVSKIGVVKFTEIVAAELKNSGVYINAIAPGAINTNMLNEVLKAGKIVGEKELKEAKKRLKEGGDSLEEAVLLVLFLASDKSNGLSGKLISAVWDDWKNWDKNKIAEIMKSDKYTLRRVK